MLVLYFLLGCTCLIFRLAYLFVPIYDVFCQTTTPGSLWKELQPDKLISLKESNNIIEIYFEAENNNGFTFKPHVKSLTTVLGKPTLAFYTIKNLGTEPLQGIRTFNITPRKAAPFFYKLECFCFDEQRIKGLETLDLPILFYISPEILEDHFLATSGSISLSYVFNLLDDNNEK